MQAIILAAGMGRRLGEYTKDNTKCMVPVNGVRLIDRLLHQLSNLELSRVVIVVGYQAENLKSYIGTRYADQLTIEYVENPVYDKTALALVSHGSIEDALCECDKVSTVSNEVGLALQGDSSGKAVLSLYENTTIGSLAVAALSGDSQTALAEQLLGMVEITLSLCQSLLDISQSGTCHGAKLLNIIN